MLKNNNDGTITDTETSLIWMQDPSKGIIITANLVSSFLSRKEIKEFCLSFSPVPVICLGISLDGI